MGHTGREPSLLSGLGPAAPVVCVCLLASLAWAEGAFIVQWREDRLSVTAERVPLARVIREVARQTGVETRGLEGLRQEVSVRFSDLLLHDGLRRLLLGVDFVLVEAPSPQGRAGLALALVLGRQAAAPPGGAADPEGAPVPDVTILGEAWGEPAPEVVILGPDGREVRE